MKLEIFFLIYEYKYNEYIHSNTYILLYYVNGYRYTLIEKGSVISYGLYTNISFS